MTHATPPLLVSLHIPKTGGSTLLHVLIEKFGDRLQRAYRPPREGLPRSESDGWPDIDSPLCIHGHAVMDRFAALIAGHPDVHWMTFLREPFSSAVSFYYYRKTYTPWAGDGPGFEDRGLEEFVLKQYNHNRFTSRLGRAGWTLESLDFVGLTERFDESMLMMYRTFGWEWIGYEAANRGKYSRDEIDPAVRQEFESLNQRDYQLYRAAEARLERSIEMAGGEFQRDLGRFRELLSPTSG
ncbi:MAG TPA: hypothetical protein VIL86_10960 [Tepidisphaeraceae bacterium]|jgi:hypothetical protein